MPKLYQVVQSCHFDVKTSCHIPGSCITFEAFIIVFYLFICKNIDRKRLSIIVLLLIGTKLVLSPVSQYQHLLYAFIIHQNNYSYQKILESDCIAWLCTRPIIPSLLQSHHRQYKRLRAFNRNIDKCLARHMVWLRETSTTLDAFYISG